LLDLKMKDKVVMDEIREYMEDRVKVIKEEN
jgi:hypothetical protein